MESPKKIALSVLVAFCLFSSVVMSAANVVKGRVVDYSTQKPLDGVEITFYRHPDIKTVITTVRSERGEYKYSMDQTIPRFVIVYRLNNGGKDRLGYHEYSRDFPAENDANEKDVDTIAMVPRKPLGTSYTQGELKRAIEGLTAYFSVTRDGKALDTLQTMGVPRAEVERKVSIRESLFRSGT